MGRQPRFDEGDILEAALHRIAAQGPGAATIAGIAGDLGAPTGSLYHRFRSKDLLIATLWLDVAEEFQEGFLSVLGGGDPVEAGRSAILWSLDWCRRNPERARLLMLHRRSELLEGEWPDEVVGRAAALAGRAEAGMRRFAKRRLGSGSKPALWRVRLALVDLPIGAARSDIEERRVPSHDLDGLLPAAADAILDAP